MMRWLYKLPLRFRSLFRKGRVEQNLCLNVSRETSEASAPPWQPVDSLGQIIRPMRPTRPHCLIFLC